MLRMLFFTCSIFCALPLMAQVVVEEFEIRPAICVIDIDSPCDQQFIFHWRLSQTWPVCVHQNKLNPVLFCRDSSLSGTVRIGLKVDSDNEFFLILAGQSETSPMKRSISIQRLGKDVRLMRRHLWSVF